MQWITSVTDPNRGGQPNSEGASTGKRKGGSPRRRGKGKKSGPVRNGHDASASAGSAGTPAAERRSELAFADGPIRKRKRRRRGKRGGRRNRDEADSDEQAAADVEGHADRDADGEEGEESADTWIRISADGEEQITWKTA